MIPNFIDSYTESKSPLGSLQSSNCVPGTSQLKNVQLYCVHVIKANNCLNKSVFKTSLSGHYHHVSVTKLRNVLNSGINSEP